MSSFEDLELQKLNNLVDTFTPAESAKYGEEVRYIKYLLSLLKKQKSQKQTKQTKQEEKKTEKKVRDSLANLLKTYSIKKPTDKTMDSLPENVMEDAKLSKVSTLYYKDKDAGQQYLEQADLADKYIWPIADPIGDAIEEGYSKLLGGAKKIGKKIKQKIKGNKKGNFVEVPVKLARTKPTRLY